MPRRSFALLVLYFATTNRDLLRMVATDHAPNLASSESIYLKTPELDPLLLYEASALQHVSRHPLRLLCHLDRFMTDLDASIMPASSDH